jgi:hypothetical protein
VSNGLGDPMNNLCDDENKIKVEEAKGEEKL